jgi:hypothetical protein
MFNLQLVYGGFTLSLSSPAKTTPEIMKKPAGLPLRSSFEENFSIKKTPGGAGLLGAAA